MDPGFPTTKIVLNVGCGLSPIPDHFVGFKEIRLDIDPDCCPNIVAPMTNTGVASDYIQAVYCSHALEHIFAHEVPKALAEFYRILKPGGFVEIAVPDLRRVAQDIIYGRVESMLYNCDAGPISAIDILYGFGQDLERGKHYMAHKTGFTSFTLEKKLRRAGFMNISVIADDIYNLLANGEKPCN